LADVLSSVPSKPWVSPSQNGAHM